MFIILDPDVLEPDNILPTPLDAPILVSVQEFEGDLIDQLEGQVKENVWLQPIFQHVLQLQVLFIWSEELVILIDHYHANNDVPERE